MPTNSEKVTVVREFGLSHGDFFRIFPRVWPTHEAIGKHHVRLEFAPSGYLDILLSEQQYRRLATLKIPYMDIEFIFYGVDELQRTEFFKKFERAFQKGGG